HGENAARIAEFLQNHPKVSRVFWVGLPDHPGKKIVARQMRGYGGMISFVLRDESMEAAMVVLKKTRLFALAESLGGVESLIGHPATMTHGAIPREERLRHGLSDGLIRLSVGIEAVDDLIGDLNEAIG